MSNPRWILAFDASCGRCRRISGAVARVAGDRLQVLPLTHPDVTRWRTRSFGKNPPWAPTLLRVSPAGDVRGWAGPAVVVPIARLLGVRPTIELLRALGRAHEAETTNGTGAGSGRRGQLGLLPVGAGALLVGWLMLNAKIGPGGGGSGDNDAQRWVQENLNQLPQDYDSVTAHPVHYRQAMYPHLSPGVRSQLWSEQFRRYAAAHPDLPPAQRQVLDTATAFAGDAANFAPGAAIDTGLQQQADAAFGRDQAARLFAVLGSDVPTSQMWPTVPAGQMSPMVPPGRRGCTCSTANDWCDNTTVCYNSNQCDITDGGCGWLWKNNCNGLCK